MRRVGIISQRLFARSLITLLAILFLQLPNYAMGQQTTVVTYNLFIGAEIQSLAGAPDLPTFLNGVKDVLDQIAANDFTERAEALAAVIAEKDPELICLQEVYDIKIDGNNTEPPFRNYQDDLIAALEDQGAFYIEAATVTNLNLNFGPLFVPTYGTDISFKDRDVILRRWDVETTVVTLTPFPFCHPSEDGCNYDTVAEADTPVGSIRFERGYVAVDVLSGALPMRVYDTHLEVRDPQPGNPLSPLAQRVQAMELILAINFINVIIPPPGPVLVVGDINSSPEDSGTINGLEPPYMQLEDAGYIDAWTLRPGKPKGYTCCFDEDLSIPWDLYERIDVIFSNVIPNRVKANVLGNDEADQTASGLWPSDHAGVAARMWF